MDVHPSKNGINRYWFIATWNQQFSTTFSAPHRCLDTQIVARAFGLRQRQHNQGQIVERAAQVDADVDDPNEHGQQTDVLTWTWFIGGYSIYLFICLFIYLFIFIYFGFYLFFYLFTYLFIY